MSDEVERTLCQLPSCHVFKIPIRRSADGHRAADWPKDPTWTGKLKVVAKGRNAAILLLDSNNQLFAMCPVAEGAVERTLDSGRYFVLRIQNNEGKHAFIGIAFNERNDAFDFNVALQEHKNECEREDKALSGELDSSASISLGNLSLREGEKIKINIGGANAKREKKQSTITQTSGRGGPLLAPPPTSSGPLLLAPPPGRSGAVAPPNSQTISSWPLAAQQSSKSSPTDNDNLFQDFALATDPSTAKDDFGVGSAFGKSDPFAVAHEVTAPPGTGITSVFTFEPLNSAGIAGSAAASTSNNVDAFGFPVSHLSSATTSPSPFPVPMNTKSGVSQSDNLLDLNF